jgi:hypothetical protein
MSQVKFGRTYKFTAQFQDGSILNIELPTTIEFNLTRSTLGSINNAQIRIYNLGSKNRQLLRYDWSNNKSNIIVTLTAGYGVNLPIIFKGNIAQAWSYREGTDFVTTIQVQDGGFTALNSLIPPSCNFAAGTTLQKIYKTLMGYLQNCSFGAIGKSYIYEKDAQGNLTSKLLKTSRSTSYTGDVIENLTTLSGRGFFIDNGMSYIATNKEFSKIQGLTPIIDASTGLLNTPLIEVQKVTFDMIFEPSLFVGQLIQLKSQSAAFLNNVTINNQTNNYYKITSLKHRAMISPDTCGDAITTVEFFPINSPI